MLMLIIDGDVDEDDDNVDDTYEKLTQSCFELRVAHTRRLASPLGPTRAHTHPGNFRSRPIRAPRKPGDADVRFARYFSDFQGHLGSSFGGALLDGIAYHQPGTGTSALTSPRKRLGQFCSSW